MIDGNNESQVTNGKIISSASYLGYASTVHKSQGKTIPIIIYDFSDGIYVNRNLLYTALSRAQNKVIIIMPKGIDRKYIFNSKYKPLTLEALS